MIYILHVQILSKNKIYFSKNKKNKKYVISHMMWAHARKKSHSQ
jgi:hypothetical protein